MIKKFISSFFIEPTITSPFTKDLTGCVIVITGGSRGLGAAMSTILSREGATVIELSRSGENSTDITDEAQVQEAISHILKSHGHIDVLINNAGQNVHKPLDQCTGADFESIIGTNVKGAFLMSKAVIPIMRKQKSGLIINIGSKISHNTNVGPGKVLYTTSKYAIEGFSLALSKELKKHGIRVTCLMLGTINTFVSLKSKDFLSPHNVGYVVSMIIKNTQIDFESILMKSAKQDI